MREHLKDPLTCPELASLVRRSLLASDITRMPSLGEIIIALPSIKFRKDINKKGKRGQ